MISFVAAGAASITFSSVGCGGGGGNSTPETQTSRASLSIQWPARTRSASAPASALSAVVRIAAAGLGSSDLLFTINRDNARLEGYSEQYSAPADTRTGQFTVTVIFYAQPNGQGGVVGTVSKTVTLTSGANSLGDLTVEGTIASIALAARQSIPVNGTSDLIFTPFDTSNRAIAGVTPGSAQFTILDGQEFVSIVNGQMQAGGTAGVASIAVTIDGETSNPQKVGIGSAISSITATGTRGPVPLTGAVDDLSGGVTYTRGAVQSGQSLIVISNWFYPHKITAPPGYGDRVFDHWAAGNLPISSVADFNYVPADIAGNLSYTAVYTTRARPAGGFVPNFSRSEFLHWQQFPLRVYFANPEVAARLRAGLDKWVEATGGVISYETVTDPALADVTFALGTPPSGLKGITTLDFDPDTRKLLHADVVLLQSAPAETYPNGIDLLALYAAHEFGHALGMTASAEAGSGHSTDPKDTMFPALNPAEPFITERDVNTLENIYPGLFGGGTVSSGTRAMPGTKGTGRTERMTVQCP
jgi:hypothetical protein